MVYADFVLENMLTEERFQVLERQVGKFMSIITYPVGDFLIKIKNAAMAGNRDVTTKSTKLIESVAKVLKEENYLDSYDIKDGQISVRLKFYSKKPVLMSLKLVSRPGLRRYVSAKELNSLKGPEVYVISTSFGVMSSKKAKKDNLGGELIAQII